MGNKNRTYIENLARTLKGQLGITDGAVGEDNYYGDIVAAGIRTKCFERVFVDLHHWTEEKLAGICRYAILEGPDVPNIHETRDSWYELHGKQPCTVNFVHRDHRSPDDWLKKVRSERPEIIIRFMAATVIVAAMYDIVIREKVKVPDHVGFA